MATRARQKQTRSDAPRWAPTEVTELDPLQQIAGRELPAGAVAVGAHSRWANPFCTGTQRDSRAVALAQYAVWLAGRADLLAAAGSELADLACECSRDQLCHREVLLDVANPPANAFKTGGRVIGLTLRRPSASLMLVPEQVGGKTVKNRSWATDYKGAIVLYGGTRLDAAGVGGRCRGFRRRVARHAIGMAGGCRAGRCAYGAGGCCAPWGHQQRADIPCYHWVFARAARFALPTWDRGFLGLRPVSWSVLVRRSALAVPGEQRR